MSPTSHPQRRPDVETYVLPDGTSLLYDPANEAGHPLDLVQSLIWEYCDGACSADEIAREVAALAPADPAAHEFALHMLNELAERGLLLSPAQALGIP